MDIFKKYNNLSSYILIVTLSTLLCIGSIVFVTNKEIEKDIDIAKTIISGFESTEYYIQANLKSATIALNYYLKANGGDSYTPDYHHPESLMPLTKELGVNNFSIYGADGKAKFTVSGSMLRDPEHFKKYNLLQCNNRIEMMNENYANVNKPLQSGVRETFVYQEFANISWFKNRKQFIGTGIQAQQLSSILNNSLSSNYINKVVISSPVGVVLMDTCNIDNTCDVNIKPDHKRIDVKFEDYNESPVILSKYNSFTISIPFGGLKDSCGKLSVSSGDSVATANSKGQYFYVMNVTFDRTELNKQIVGIILIFVVLALLACLYIHEKNHHSDNVYKLSNQRLGDVRRYITKIAKDSMKMESMESKIPNQMVMDLKAFFDDVDKR